MRTIKLVSVHLALIHCVLSASIILSVENASTIQFLLAACVFAAQGTIRTKKMSVLCVKILYLSATALEHILLANLILHTTAHHASVIQAHTG